MKTYNFAVNGYFFSVKVDENGSGTIKSELSLEKSKNENDPINGAIHAIESLILSHACAGIKVSSEEYKAGLETTIEAMFNYYD